MPIIATFMYICLFKWLVFTKLQQLYEVSFSDMSKYLRCEQWNRSNFETSSQDRNQTHININIFKLCLNSTSLSQSERFYANFPQQL